jgi:general secretion pathway protein I
MTTRTSMYSSTSIASRTITGFTLIECLIALFILALIFAAATRAVGVITTDLHDARIKEAAVWAAVNEINNLVGYQSEGDSEFNRSIDGYNFQITRDITETPNPFFRQVDITVREDGETNYYLYKLTSFISQH